MDSFASRDLLANPEPLGAGLRLTAQSKLKLASKDDGLMGVTYGFAVGLRYAHRVALNSIYSGAVEAHPPR